MLSTALATSLFNSFLSLLNRSCRNRVDALPLLDNNTYIFLQHTLTHSLTHHKDFANFLFKNFVLGYWVMAVGEQGNITTFPISFFFSFLLFSRLLEMTNLNNHLGTCTLHNAHRTRYRDVGIPAVALPCRNVGPPEGRSCQR